MKYRSLVALPFAAAAALVAALALAPAAAHAHVLGVESELAKLCALVGCAAAALRFGRRDYLRIAWMLLGACYALILSNDLLFGAGGLRAGGLLAGHHWAVVVGAVVVLVANAAQLVGTIMIARVWRVAGFDLAVSTGVRRLVQLGAIVFALAAAGWLAWTSGHGMARGDFAAMVDFVSSIGDIVSFSLIAPFLLTAITLRGGSLGWTWGLLTASLVGWLLFDASLAYGPALFGHDHATSLCELFRLFACTFALGAGLAQRWGVRATPAAARASVAAA